MEDQTVKRHNYPCLECIHLYWW